MTCALETGSDDPAALLRYLSMLDLDFSVADSPALAAEARRLAERLIRASEQRRPLQSSINPPSTSAKPHTSM